MLRKTKIIATVGPACDTYEQMLGLVHAGVNVFRLNFSHGTHEKHAEVIENITRINENFPLNIAILADLQGPKLRVGKIKDGGLQLLEGDEIAFTHIDEEGTKDNLYISYPGLHNDAKKGEKILLDDGKIETEVIAVSEGKVTAKVLNDGLLLSNKGVNLPNTKISLPSLTEKDLRDIDFIVGQEIDWVGLSFVRHPEDIEHLRKRLADKNSKAKIIAKVEKPEAIQHLREVILASDAVMIARGDLGVEMPVEKIPKLQTDIIRMCIHRAKPVIVATQMMESMIDRTKPNRSEITDVANAVKEGTDAVMLSGETAMGMNPALVVTTMSNIILEVEKEKEIYNKNLTPQAHSPSFLSDALCYNACKIAEDVNAQAIIGMTQSGYTGFMLSSFRPQANLFVFTKTLSLVQQLSLSWGVQAFYYDEEDNIDRIISDQIQILKDKGLVTTNDIVVNTGSMPVSEHLPTNMMKISRVF